MDLIVAFSAPSRESRRIPAARSQLLIGRDPRAEIRLDHPTVSRRHARIVLEDGENRFSLEDGGSSNGTWVDGSPLRGRSHLLSDQVVGIGPYRFRVCASPTPGPSKTLSLSNGPKGPAPDPPKGASALSVSMGAPPPLLDPALEEEMVRRASEMLPRLVPPPAEGREADPEVLAREAQRLLYPKVLEMLPGRTGAETAERITLRALTCALGLGPLEAWLSDASVTEIMINGTGNVFLERGGRLHQERPVFDSEKALMRIVDRILSPIGRRVDETTPCVDGRLPDGSRINVVVPPISLGGPVITIRKFPSRRLTMDDLVSGGTLTAEAAALLEKAVMARRNILVSGGTGTGKTTFLNLLAGFISRGERIVTIEDAAELSLPQDHVVRLEVRPPNIEGRGEVTMRDLVRNSLRMRPDRIIIGECRGGEALDMLQAMNTGHEGSMTTCHANTPRDALKRIETMALMGEVDLPHQVVREQVSSAIHLIIQLQRSTDGRRMVERIVEVTGMEGAQLLTQEIFRREDEGSLLSPTGLIPGFARARGRAS
jgi:pilus assembly protein CpaF